MTEELPRAATSVEAMRDAIKTAIQVAQDSTGELLYVIPDGAAGIYADAIMRVLEHNFWAPGYSAAAWIDKTLDNCGDLPADLSWRNEEVIEMLREIRTALLGVSDV